MRFITRTLGLGLGSTNLKQYTTIPKCPHCGNDGSEHDFGLLGLLSYTYIARREPDGSWDYEDSDSTDYSPMLFDQQGVRTYCYDCDTEFTVPFDEPLALRQRVVMGVVDWLCRAFRLTHDWTA